MQTSPVAQTPQAPAHAPVHTPAQAPVHAPAHAPVQTPAHAPVQALLSSSQPVYDVRGNVVFGTCDKIQEYDGINNLLEAALILQGMESLSSPPRQKTVPRVDPTPIRSSTRYLQLLKDPARWHFIPKLLRGASRSPASGFSSANLYLTATHVIRPA